MTLVAERMAKLSKLADQLGEFVLAAAELGLVIDSILGS